MFQKTKSNQDNEEFYIISWCKFLNKGDGIGTVFTQISHLQTGMKLLDFEDDIKILIYYYNYSQISASLD